MENEIRIKGIRGLIGELYFSGKFCCEGCPTRDGGVCIGKGLVDDNKCSVIYSRPVISFGEIRPSGVMRKRRYCPKGLYAKSGLLPFEEK